MTDNPLEKSPEDRKTEDKAAHKQTQNEGKTDAREKADDKKAADEKPASRDAKKDKEAPKREIVLERRVTLNCRRALSQPQNRRAKAALVFLRAQIARHLKTRPDAVRIDGRLARFAAGPGGRHPAAKVTVLAQKDKAGLVTATLAPLGKTG